jgi:hypothetical protein
MYLEYVAPCYTLPLNPDQLSWIGLIVLIAMAAVAIFNLGSRLRPPVKHLDYGSPRLKQQCTKKLYYQGKKETECG